MLSNSFVLADRLAWFIMNANLCLDNDNKVNFKSKWEFFNLK